MTLLKMPGISLFSVRQLPCGRSLTQSKFPKGVGMFAVTYTYMLIWTYTGEVNAKRIREKYLKAVLRQDIAFFDQLGAGEVATRIQTDTHLVQQGISEKVARE